MTARALPLGFGLIGPLLQGLARFLFMHIWSETRMGQRLLDDRSAIDAEGQEATFVQGLSCTGGMIKSCRRSEFGVAFAAIGGIAGRVLRKTQPASLDTLRPLT